MRGTRKGASRLPLALCLYEDAGSADLSPLTLTRPAADLRCGILTLREKVEWAFGQPVGALVVPPRLAGYRRAGAGADEPSMNDLSGLAGRPVLFLLGRVLLRSAPMLPRGVGRAPLLFEVAGEIVGALLPRLPRSLTPAALQEDPVAALAAVAGGAGRMGLEATVIRDLWDLVEENGAEICADLRRLPAAARGRRPAAGVIALGPRDIHIQRGAVVHPGAALDARDGPIWVGAAAEVAPCVAVHGPAAIGAGARIVGGRVRGGTTVGPRCHVGGEVEASILQGYSNKAHEGFLGHSYVGEWVNIGALTTTSDLKNSYREVQVMVGGRARPTGLVKVGAFLGDHVKTGIGTLLDTGATIGIGSNLFGGGLLPRTIPSFSWGGREGLVEYNLEVFLETAARVMARRAMGLTSEGAGLLRRVFEATREERLRAGILPRGERR